MPEKLISTDPPQPRPDDFEEYLATDDLFVDFFNRFLELPSFPEPHRFNPLTGGFEVLSPAKNQLAEKIKSISRAQRPKSSVYKNAIANPPIRLPHYEEEEEEKGVGEEIKTSFNVKCLDKEQGFHWMKKHRLSQFLRSDLYIEYRLAKLLSQIETSKAGMKLTISPTYRPWYKPEPEREREEVIDDTADMIKLLQASVGSMTTTQTKEWFTIAKQLEESTTSSTGNSRPTSSLSSFRTETTTKSDKLKLSHRKEGNIETATTDRFKSSVTFASTLSESDKDDKDEIARFMPQPIKSSTQMGHVIKIEPVLSDDESDQGVGSECDDVKEDFEKPQTTSSSVESLRSDEKKVDDMANKIVLFTIERAINSLSSSTQDQSISSQDANITQQDKPQTHLSVSSSKISTDDTKISSLERKTIAFKILDEPLEDEADSVFSDETDELGSVSSFKFEEFISVKEFCKFRAFLKKTVGDKLMRLWMDIDRTRFSIASHKMGSFLQRMRETYLKVGSMNRLPNEILKKHDLIHATQWTLKHLHSVQKYIVEPLLLYWAPRFLMSQMTTSAKEPELSKGFPARSRLFRPTSSQSYPSPKTITILPLRPKSCLPRIKQGQRPSTKLGHVVSEYHQFTEPSIYLEPHKTPNPLTTPSPIPDYLQPKVMSLVEEANSPQLMLPRRPATAGPLTRQTKARLERKKSAAAKSSRAPTIVRMPLTRPSPPASVSSDSTVRGSPAMESMLQALYHDTRAGWFFTQFCEKSKNSSWSNAVHFWFDVQQYHYLFYQEIIDQFIIEKKSKMIYSTYIVNGAHEDIGVSPHIRNQIRSMINPPYDELFDAAEEHALKLLIVPWNKMLGLDRESYNRVELIEEERRLAVAAKYQACLQKKGILKKRRSVMPDFEAEKKHVDDLWSKVPEEFQSFTFDDLIRNRIELEYFRKFLEQNYVKTDLMCWLDIETFKRINHHAAAKRDEKAKEIREKYLNKKYFFGPTSPATKEEQNEAVKAGGGWGKTLKERPPTQLIVEAQVYVRKRIETRWLPLFLASKEYQDRQHPHSQMSDAAEDVVLQKKKKRGEPWKMLDNRWQSSLRDLMEFRRALCNPVTAAQFRRYASMRGEFLENDVLFWLEVQKYKDFCHIHNDSSAIESKVTSIINCFIHSHIPPSLQIDISHEMAEKLVEKRRDLGPYVFREAQLTVFRVLFPHWNSFCEFRKTLSDDKLTAKLERQKKKKLERMKQQLKEQEKEEARREELRASREAEVFDLPDVGSLKGSDLGENLFAVPRTQVSWSYGKYVEGLDRQRMLLLMENEVKGRVPLEALPDPDYNVASDDSDAESGSDDAKSTGSTDKTKKKRKKEKIIHSTVKTPPASDVTSVQNITNKKVMTSNQEIKSRNQDKNRKSDSAAPAVVVD